MAGGGSLFTTTPGRHIHLDPPPPLPLVPDVARLQKKTLSCGPGLGPGPGVRTAGGRIQLLCYLCVVVRIYEYIWTQKHNGRCQMGALDPQVRDLAILAQDWQKTKL